VVYSEAHESWTAARKREAQIKHWTRAKKERWIEAEDRVFISSQAAPLAVSRYSTEFRIRRGRWNHTLPSRPLRVVSSIPTRIRPSTRLQMMALTTISMSRPRR